MDSEGTNISQSYVRLNHLVPSPLTNYAAGAPSEFAIRAPILGGIQQSWSKPMMVQMVFFLLMTFTAKNR